MRQPHVIGIALDLARMPALARTPVNPPIPSDIIELMRIAAASPSACQTATTATGEPMNVVVAAARFYLQQSLFRPDADCYRILGICPGTPRAVALGHMRLLLQWLHPDRNSDLETVYAERVLAAWREVSALNGSAVSSSARGPKASSARERVPFYLPWIKYPKANRSSKRFWHTFAGWLLPIGRSSSPD